VSSRRPYGYHCDATEVPRRFNGQLIAFGMRVYCVLCASTLFYISGIETSRNLGTSAVEIHRVLSVFLLRYHGTGVVGDAYELLGRPYFDQTAL
jgi:hypothetical protein